jgi:DNA-binding XRE family transcriptional regulator
MRAPRKSNRKYVGPRAAFQRLKGAIGRARKRSGAAAADYIAACLAMEVAEKIHDARVKARMTQAQVAARADVSQSFIARLENPSSAKRPSLTRIAKVAAALNKRRVSIDFV